MPLNPGAVYGALHTIRGSQGQKPLAFREGNLIRFAPLSTFPSQGKAYEGWYKQLFRYSADLQLFVSPKAFP